jgi:hypothetical protein
MARSRYQFTLGQFAKLIFWCAFYFMTFRVFLDRDLPTAFLIAPLGIILIAPALWFAIRLTRYRFSRSPAPGDPCGPIVWRGLDNLGPDHSDGGHEPWRPPGSHSNSRRSSN